MIKLASFFVNSSIETIKKIEQITDVRPLFKLIDFREIKELDMNPVLVMEKGEGCKILDVRIGI